MGDLRINMIMCSNGPVSRLFYEKWLGLYRHLGFNWRFLDFGTGFDFKERSIEIEIVPQKTHGLCLNHLYRTRRHSIEIYCDLDSFPVSPRWAQWVRERLSEYSLVAAEDNGPIRNYPGKVSPSFMAFSDRAPPSLDFTCKKRSHDTAHLILNNYPKGEWLLLNQSSSSFGNGTFYCHGGERMWYHQWYLRKEKSDHVKDAERFFAAIDNQVAHG